MLVSWDFMGFNGIYPLEMTNIADWNITIVHGKTHEISMAIFHSDVTNYWRVVRSEKWACQSWGLLEEPNAMPNGTVSWSPQKDQHTAHFFQEKKRTQMRIKCTSSATKLLQMGK